MTRLFHRFRSQLIMWFLLIILLPTFMISVMFFKNTADSQMERQERILSQQTEEYVNLLASRMESVEKDGLSIVGNMTVTEYLSYPYRNPVFQVRDALYSFQPVIRWILQMNKQYNRIHFLTDSIYTSGDPYVDAMADYAQEPWVAETMSAGLKGIWLGTHRAQTFRYALTPSRDVISYALRIATIPEGLVLLDIDPDWLYQGIALVIDCDTGKVLYSDFAPDAVGAVAQPPKDFGMISLNLGNELCYANMRACDELGVWVVAVANQQQVRQSILENDLFFLLLLAVCIPMTLALVIIFSNSVVRRMTVIRENISRITRGDYDVSFEPHRDDEIDELGTDVVIMGRRMNQMVNHELNQKMLLREAEFRALTQQINPHFIFNVLQTVQMMAEISDQRELADVITQFGRMVRYNLYAEQDVPLREELNNVHDYLMLQKLMYNDELNAVFSCDSAYLEVEVPRLILQPLVENAVVHGKMKDRVLNVWVSVEQISDVLTVRIMNDGKPLDPDHECQLRELLAEVVAHPGSVDGANAPDNLALINIQKRLNIRFGSDCRLEIFNTSGKVEVRFAIELEGRPT